MSWAAKSAERFDIIYILSKDLERVLDYKEELETVFDAGVRKKLKVVGRGDQYAIIYDGNQSAASVSETLIQHTVLLHKAGFDKPYATKEQDFHALYNVSYGMGKNLVPLKKKYGQLYGRLGEEVRPDLFIEKTDYGNYILVYRFRGSKEGAAKVAREHAKILGYRKKGTSVSLENNNLVVYGESSLINDGGGAKLRITGREKKKTTPSGDSRFEQSIEKFITNLRRNGKISGDESTGWMVYDLAKDRSIVDINADKEFQAASMIKPFIALAFFHQVKTGKLKYGPKSRKKMEAMIQRSSNSATNWVMRQAGGPARCNAILKKYYGHILKKTEIKEYIPKGGKTYLNSASPADYVRFLRALWKKKLPSNWEIRRLMALPGRDRLYHGTQLPKGTLVYNKTGSTAHLCGDMGILVPKTQGGGQYPYVIVGIIERRSRPSNYGKWMASRGKVIREVSTLVYKQMKQKHHLL